MRMLSARTIIAALPPAGPMSIATTGTFLLSAKFSAGTIASLSRRHHDDALRALGDQVVEVGDLLAGIAVGVGDRQGLQPRLLGLGHRQVDLDRLERVGEETDRVAHRERLAVGRESRSGGDRER